MRRAKRAVQDDTCSLPKIEIANSIRPTDITWSKAPARPHGAAPVVFVVDDDVGASWRL